MKHQISYLLLLAVLVLGGCKNENKSTEAEQEEKPEVKIKFHALNGGNIKVNKLEIFSENGEFYQGESKDFVDPFYIIEHPDGTMIWDTGLPENLVGLPEPFTTPNGAFTVSRKDSLAHQLNEIGLKIEDIDYLALSHWHFDHIGTAHYFKKTTWLVQENEFNYVRSDSLAQQQPLVYEALKDFNNVIRLKGDFDVFGDGRVVIKYMPGHTIGHQALYLELDKNNRLLLSGDLYHFEENRTHKRAPSFNYDPELTYQSMEKFEAFAKEKQAEVIIQHQPSYFEKTQKILNP